MDQMLITTGAYNGVDLLDLRRAHRHEVRMYVYNGVDLLDLRHAHRHEVRTYVYGRVFEKKSVD